MKKSFLSMAMIVFTTSNVLAKVSAKEQLEKIKTNLENSKANLEDYKTNLGVVEKNIVEVSKAKNAGLDQKKQISLQVKENTEALKKIEKKEKELNTLTQDEKTKSAAEEKRVKELEEMIAKIRENQKKRELNVQNYQTQLTQLQTEKKTWESRGQTLKEQENQNAQQLKTLNAQESEWKNKKKGYEGEIGRWSKEITKQQKLVEQYSALAETKE